MKHAWVLCLEHFLNELKAREGYGSSSGLHTRIPGTYWDPSALAGREQDSPGVPWREERRKGGPLLATRRGKPCHLRSAWWLSAVWIDKQLSSMNQTLCVCSEVQVSSGNREQWCFCCALEWWTLLSYLCDTTGLVPHIIFSCLLSSSAILQTK